MSFRAYKRISDGKIFYAFRSEAWSRLPADMDGMYMIPAEVGWHVNTQYIELPPDPTTILATSVFMTDMPYLDSMKTMYELDRILNIEAEQDREDKAYQALVKQL